MALQPFTWGRGGEKLSPNQVKRYQDIASALAADNKAATTFGGGLAKIGDALLHNSYNARAAEGEKAGAASRQAVVDALMANPDPGMSDLIGAMSDPWVQDDAGTSAIVQALMGREMQQSDPMYQQNLERGALELEALRNPAPAAPEYEIVDGEVVWLNPAQQTATSGGQFGQPEPEGFSTVTLQLPDGTQRTLNTANPAQAQMANELLGQGAIEVKGSLVDINMPGDQGASNFFTSLGEAERTNYETMLANGQNAGRTLAQLDQLEGLLANTPQGFEAAERRKIFDGGYRMRALH